MKRIAVLLLVASSAGALDWIDFEGQIAVGWMPHNSLHYWYAPKAPIYDPLNSFFAVMTGKVLLLDRHVYVRADVGTEMSCEHIRRWNPRWMEYAIEAGLTWGPVTAYFRHVCIHPIMTYHQGGARVWGEGGVEHVGLRIGNLHE